MLKRIISLAALLLLPVMSGCTSTPIRFADTLPTITARDLEAAATDTSVSISILSDPDSGDVPKEALARLRQESGLPISVRFEGGIPVFLDGAFPLPPGFSDDPVRRALGFLARHRDLYRLEDPHRQLFLTRIATDELGSHLFFGQRHEDLTVLGAELAVHLEKTAVAGTNGRYLPEIPELRPAALSREDAESKALAAVPGEKLEVRGESQLVIFKPSLFGLAGDEGTLLAWRVTAQGQRKDGLWTSWSVLVDAADGSVLLLLDETRQHAPHMDFAIYTANGSERHDCGGRGLTQLYDASGPISDSTWDLESRAAWNHLHTTYNYFFNHFHRHSWDNLDGQAKVIVHAGVNYRGARFICNLLEFGDGFAVLDMLAHEFTHAVDGRLVYADQSGALSESYADVFGALVDADDWTIGEDLPWPSSNCGATYPPGTLRDLSNPPACSSPDHMSNLIVLGPDITRTELNDWGLVHFNSGIPNKAAYLLIQGGTHHGVTVQGIGRAKVGRLYYDVLTTRLRSNARLIDARDLTVAAASAYARRGLYGFRESDVCSVIQAFAAVGLGDSVADCDFWSLWGGRFHVRVTEERIVRIPFPPCLTCPPWLPEGFWIQIVVKAEKGWGARVIDEEGAVLAVGLGKAKQVLRFYPRSDSLYRSPWVTAIQGKETIPLRPAAAKRYFLELVPPPNLEPGMEAEVEVSIPRQSRGL